MYLDMLFSGFLGPLLVAKPFLFRSFPIQFYDIINKAMLIKLSTESHGKHLIASTTVVVNIIRL